MSLTNTLQKQGVFALCYKGLKFVTASQSENISDDFELSSNVEFYDLGREPVLIKKLTCQVRMIKLIWIPHVNYENGGLLVAANDNNAVGVYDISKLFAMNDEEDVESALITSLETNQNAIKKFK